MVVTEQRGDSMYSYETGWDIEDDMFKAQIADAYSTVYLLKSFNDSKQDIFYVRDDIKFVLENSDIIYYLNILIGKNSIGDLNAERSHMTMTDLKNMYKEAPKNRRLNYRDGLCFAVEYLDDYPNLPLIYLPNLSLPTFAMLKKIGKSFLNCVNEIKQQTTIYLDRSINFTAQPDKKEDYESTDYYIIGYICSPKQLNYNDKNWRKGVLERVKRNKLKKNSMKE